jgi:PAS domain S-box-containing protein
MYGKSLRILFSFAIVSYILIIILIFKILQHLSYSYSFEQVQNNIMLVKAQRTYVSEHQKQEIYRLQNKGYISYDYFKPVLLSSTYSAKTVNDLYNTIRKEHHLEPIKIRFASNNPRNPKNKANQFESELLKKFNDKSITQYRDIRHNKDGKKVIYFAMPSRPLEEKCMRCHSTPNAAPKELVETYGDTNGFYEKIGSIRALISTEFPLSEADTFIYKTTFLLSIVALFLYAVFIGLYIRYSKNIYKNNQELEKLNLSLEEKVNQNTYELVNSNNRLKQQKNFLDTFIQTTPIPLFVKNKEGKYLEVNKKFCEFTGYAKEDIIGKSIHDIAPKDIADIYYKKDKKVLSLEENPQVYESHVVNKTNNKRYDVIFYKSAYFDDHDKVVGIIGSVIDITTIKQLEKENIDREKKFFEQSKKAEIGEMLNNIAHQWRQPLSVISTAASGMQIQKEMDILKDKDFYSYCKYIDENAQYLSQTIDDFRNYMKGDSKPLDFNLKNDIDSFLKLVNPTIKDLHIQLILGLDEDINIQGYPNELIQCFINIFNNAKDAFIEKNIPEDERYMFITQQRLNNEIILVFKDSAGGIDKKISPKVFDPYFTTKHQSIGTGLGLYIVHNIIENKMKGKIEVTNDTYTFKQKKYTGAKFTITLPV